MSIIVIHECPERLSLNGFANHDSSLTGTIQYGTMEYDGKWTVDTAAGEYDKAIIRYYPFCGIRLERPLIEKKDVEI